MHLAKRLICLANNTCSVGSHVKNTGLYCLQVATRHMQEATFYPRSLAYHSYTCQQSTLATHLRSRIPSAPLPTLAQFNTSGAVVGDIAKLPQRWVRTVQDPIWVSRFEVQDAKMQRMWICRFSWRLAWRPIASDVFAIQGKPAKNMVGVRNFSRCHLHRDLTNVCMWLNVGCGMSNF